jgi:PTH1 family peptidyl-tRNA hydrolase
MIIIGLGNPGTQFEHTRHNAGFMAVDFFAQKNEFPDFALSKKYNSLISKKDGIVLAKPQTFMNESGKAAQQLLANSTERAAVIVHDDVDVALGDIKISKERGSAGHKGVESIIQHIGNEGLVRFRIGIRPTDEKLKDSENFVIKKFTPKEMEVLNEVLEKTSQALDLYVKEGLEKTMNAYN